LKALLAEVIEDRKLEKEEAVRKSKDTLMGDIYFKFPEFFSLKENCE
jgi:hypothetical protein